VSNPPFRKKGTGILSQNQERSIARYELALTMAGLLKICRSLVKAKGKVALIYPFERLKELVAELAKTKLNPSRLKLVFHKKSDPLPILFCMELRKGKTRLLLEPPCYVETDQGRFRVGRDDKMI
jgi:tRNA1Val (adenine37-N6)-methyltransferase